MTIFSIRLVLALCCIGLFVLAQGAEAGAAETSLYIDIKESEAPGARVVERWKLYGSSHALVIGIDDYVGGWPKLSNAVRDAREIADELERHGFQVTLKTDPDARELRDTLRAFYALRGADPEARLLLWYAGHGHTIDGEGFLVPADAPLPNDPLFKIKALHMRDFGGLMRLAKSKHVLSVFDSCFSGTIFSARAGASISNITYKTRKPVRQFITSGDAGQQVRDDGSFRKLFIRAIRGEEQADANADGFVTGEELGLYLSQRMTTLTQAAQTPNYGRLQDVNFDQGDFVFALPKKPSDLSSTEVQEIELDTVPNDPSEAALDLAFWNAIKDSDDPTFLQAYLEEFPRGRFVRLARIKLTSHTAAEPEEETTSPQPTPADATASAAAKNTDEQIAELEQSAVVAPQQALVTPPPLTFEVVEILDQELVALRNANVRAEPTVKSGKVGALKLGRTVEITGRTTVAGQTWYRVSRDGKAVGFVYGSLLGEPEPKPKLKAPETPTAVMQQLKQPQITALPPSASSEQADRPAREATAEHSAAPQASQSAALSPVPASAGEFATAEEIRAQLIGHQVKGSDWEQTYFENGTLRGVDQSYTYRGTWSIAQDGKLCESYTNWQAESGCRSVEIADNTVRYFVSRKGVPTLESTGTIQ